MAEERRRDAITMGDLREALAESRNALMEVIRDGNKGTHARLDRLNGRVDALQALTGQHEAHIENIRDSLRDRTDPIHVVAEDARPALTKGEMKLLLAVGGAILAAIELLSHQLPALLEAIRKGLQ